VNRLGHTVLYKLSEADCAAIDRESPMVDGNRTVRNAVHEGERYPAQVVAQWSADCLNLWVQLDGRGGYWATSRSQGDDPGRWDDV
jgi:hypothetical protein